MLDFSILVDWLGNFVMYFGRLLVYFGRWVGMVGSSTVHSRLELELVEFYRLWSLFVIVCGGESIRVFVVSKSAHKFTLSPK